MAEYWERLREERKRLGLSQAKFAEACGVRRTAQTTYETGARSPSTAYFKAAAKIGADAYYILYGTRDRDPALDSVLSEGQARSLKWLTDFPIPTKGSKGLAGDVDGELLGNVLACLDETLAGIEVTTSARTRADLASMLYRAFSPAGKVDPAVVAQAVRLVAL
jgi:transcriptional regulator with XRE-family HTH domain